MLFPITRVKRGTKVKTVAENILATLHCFPDFALLSGHSFGAKVKRPACNKEREVQFATKSSQSTHPHINSQKVTLGKNIGSAKSSHDSPKGLGLLSWCVTAVGRKAEVLQEKDSSNAKGKGQSWEHNCIQLHRKSTSFRKDTKGNIPVLCSQARSAVQRVGRSPFVDRKLQRTDTKMLQTTNYPMPARTEGESVGHDFPEGNAKVLLIGDSISRVLQAPCM